MAAIERKPSRANLYALIAFLALMQGGCLLAIASVAGGAAATGYFYYKGRVYRDYPANFADVRNAVHAALIDLHFFIFTEDVKDGKAFLVTKTTTGKKVKIYVDCLSSQIPAEGLITRLSIRVACFGDESVSRRIFDQVAFRLGHPAPQVIGPAPPGLPPLPALHPIQATGFETTEPKLAPAQKNEPQRRRDAEKNTEEAKNRK